MTDHISVERNGGILHIRMNRPEKKNALTRAMYATMADALTAAEDDLSVGVVLFSGSGGNFTAGNDLKDFRELPPNQGEEPSVFRFMKALARADVPIMAAVDGVAIGIGVTMLLHCDLVFCGEITRFQMPFVDLGLVPEAGSTYLLPKLMGHSQAAELILMAKPFDALRAKDLGLVNRICPAAILVETALSTAGVMAAKPPRTLRLAKSMLKQDRETVLARIDSEGQIFAECLRSPECAEALTAFAEKRKPDFSKCHTK